MNLPIFRLEIEGMKHAVSVALSEYAAKMDADIQGAIERYMTPENISAVIHDAAQKAIDETIKKEIAGFFAYGRGQRFIAAKVKERLEESMGEGN